ncbi:LIC_12616 family protein [Acinetobacter sp.]|uniref:phage neck terminator protein n=1 Tax=Acinetobacter sp. TaxID=472 RepID=UPI0038909C84
MSYIIPSGGVAYDQALEDIFQAFIKGVTGLSGKMIRPRYQNPPPSMPAVGVNWVAFNVKATFADDSPSFNISMTENTSSRHEELEVFLSFYGDQGQHYANLFKDGTAIPQNIAQLKQKKINFIECRKIQTVPDFLNQQYVHRYDVVAIYTRKTSRSYALNQE